MASQNSLIEQLNRAIANVRQEEDAAKAAGRIARGEGEVDTDTIPTPDASVTERPAIGA